MTAGNPLLVTLASRHIALANEGGRLRFRAPEGAIDIGLREALRTHKGSLLSVLADRPGYVQLSPPSYNQLSLFLLHLLERQSAAYNLALTMRLRAPVDQTQVQEAIRRLVLQHAQLRTTFGYVALGSSTAPCQFVADSLAPQFQAIGAQSWTEEQQRHYVQTFYGEPIDLQIGPVIQVRLLSCDATNHVLVLKLHHIAADGWSLQVVARDLGRHLLDVTKGQPASIPDGGGAYTDYSLEQLKFVECPQGRQQVRYWLDILSPPSATLKLRGAAERPNIRRSVGSTHYFDIDASLQTRIEDCARSLGVTAFVLQLAVFQVLLLRRSAQCDVTIGVPTLGQRSEKYRDTVGYFVNPVPLRCRRQETFTFCDHAVLTAEEMAGALEHRDAPFAAVMEKVGGARDPSRTPGFQVLFNVLSRRTLGDAVDLLYPWKTDVTTALGGLPVESFAINQQEGQFDLTLELVVRGSCSQGILKYCTDLLSATDAAAIAEEYRSLLEYATSNPLESFTVGIVSAAPAVSAESAPTSDIVMVATFTAAAMNEYFEYWFDYLGWKARLVHAPFNQVFQALLDSTSALRRNRSGFGVVLVRFDDLLRMPQAETSANSADVESALVGQLTAVTAELADAIEGAATNMTVPLCVVVAPCAPRLHALVRDLSELISQFESRVRTMQAVYVLGVDAIAGWYPVADYYEPLGEELGSIPYKPSYLAALATAIVRTLHAITQKPLKVLVVDCDGTLWEGVAGEDGVDGLLVGEKQRAFQSLLVRQAQAGVAVCLCSKNQEADVWAVFDQHPAMVLKRDHIGFWRINWQPKSQNIRELATEIGVGLETIAFLDDNPLEREEVRSNCPAVLTVDLPVDWESRTAYLSQLWPMDHIRTTETDRRRTAHYQSDRQRAKLQRMSGSLSQFLETLALEVNILQATETDVERLAQLSIRTNQFNTAGRRMSARDVVNYRSAAGSEAHSAFVRDRFGDYGLVGAILFTIVDRRLVVESFLLSCRALGRGVEHQMAVHIAERALSLGCEVVEFVVQTSERNEPARAFLASLGRLDSVGTVGDGSIRVRSSALRTLRYVPDNTTTSVFALSSSQSSNEGTDSGVINTGLAWNSRLLAIPAVMPDVDHILKEHAAFTRRRRDVRSSTVSPPLLTRPTSEVERAVVEAWETTLGLPEVSTTANFFELGGTSVLIAQLAVEMKRRGMDISIVDLLQYPTVTLMAQHVLAVQPTVKATQGGSEGRRDSGSTSARQVPSPFQQLRQFRKR